MLGMPNFYCKHHSNISDWSTGVGQQAAIDCQRVYAGNHIAPHVEYATFRRRKHNRKGHA
jgi:hypothetical protein